PARRDAAKPPRRRGLPAPGELPQIAPVFALRLDVRLPGELGAIDPAVLERDLLQAADAQALALFVGADQLAGLDQAVVGAGVLPGEASAEQLHVQLALLQIEVIERGDLQLAAGRTRQGLGHLAGA